LGGMVGWLQAAAIALRQYSTGALLCRDPPVGRKDPRGRSVVRLLLGTCSLGAPTKVPAHPTFRPGEAILLPCESRCPCSSSSPTSFGMPFPSFEVRRSVSNSLPGPLMTCGRGMIGTSTSCLGRRGLTCSRHGVRLRRGQLIFSRQGMLAFLLLRMSMVFGAGGRWEMGFIPARKFRDVECGRFPSKSGLKTHESFEGSILRTMPNGSPKDIWPK
jgi:hypothetical protein